MKKLLSAALVLIISTFALANDPVTGTVLKVWIHNGTPRTQILVSPGVVEVRTVTLAVHDLLHLHRVADLEDGVLDDPCTISDDNCDGTFEGFEE